MSSHGGASKSIVLMSGGNQGIGYEIVKKLAQENPSYHVLLVECRDTDKGKASIADLGHPTNVEPIELDITSDDSVETCFKSIEERFGKLDLRINNAGTAGHDLGDRDSKTIREIYTHCYSVNTISAAVLTEKMIPLLQNARVRIVFLTSALGSVDGTLQRKDLVDVPY